MTRDDWKGMFANFPEEEHNKLVLVLSNGTEISVDTVFRFEQHYFVCRGRVGGTVDEARGFFIPYAQMVYVRYERSMKLEELESMCVLKLDGSAAPTVPTAVAETPAPTRTPTPLGLPRPVLPSPTDPAAASRLLLERIKAARTQTARGGSATQG